MAYFFKWGTPSSKFNVLLIGKTGSGKSSSGNSIVGEQVFGSFSGTTSNTRRVKSCTKFRWGRDITVVDTPGLMETSMDEVEQCYFARRVMEDSFEISERGFHAIIIVMNYIENYSTEEKKVIAMLSEIFGRAFFNFTVLIFTHGDNFDTVKDIKDDPVKSQEQFLTCCKDLKGDLKDLILRCDSRAVLFHNNSDYKGNNKDIELQALLKHVESIKKSKRKYSRWYFADAQRTREQLMLTTCLEALKEKINSELQALKHDFELMKNQQNSLLERANEVLEALSSNCESTFPNSGEVYGAVNELNVTFKDDLTNGAKSEILTQLQTIIDCPSLHKLKLLSQDIEILLSPEKHKFQLKRRINELLQHIREEAHGTAKLAFEEERVNFFLSEVVSFDIKAVTTTELCN